MARTYPKIEEEPTLTYRCPKTGGYVTVLVRSGDVFWHVSETYGNDHIVEIEVICSCGSTHRYEI